MRLRNIAVIVAVASVLGACTAADKTPPDSAAVVADTGGTVVPPPPPPAYDVAITLECIGEDSVSFGIKPWLYTLPKGRSVRWGLVSNSIADVKLASIGNSGPWPFPEAGDVVVRRGQATQRQRGSANALNKTFRYSITGSCTRPISNRVDTIVIDPIMILPD